MRVVDGAKESIEAEPGRLRDAIAPLIIAAPRREARRGEIMSALRGLDEVLNVSVQRREGRQFAQSKRAVVVLLPLLSRTRHV